MPTYHSIDKVDGSVVNRILRVMEGSKAVTEGRAPPYYSRSDRKAVVCFAREYKRYFTQDGIPVL